MKNLLLDEIRKLRIPEDIVYEIIILQSLGVDSNELKYFLALRLGRD